MHSLYTTNDQRLRNKESCGVWSGADVKRKTNADAARGGSGGAEEGIASGRDGVRPMIHKLSTRRCRRWLLEEQHPDGTATHTRDQNWTGMGPGLAHRQDLRNRLQRRRPKQLD